MHLGHQFDEKNVHVKQLKTSLNRNRTKCSKKKKIVAEASVVENTVCKHALLVPKIQQMLCTTFFKQNICSQAKAKMLHEIF